MSHLLKSVQPLLNDVVYDLTGATVGDFPVRRELHARVSVQLSDRFNPYKKLFEDAIVHRYHVGVEERLVQKHIQG